jgi:hypothetical protein
MNKLITTPNGGFPLRSNDFRFIDESIRLALKGLASIVNDVSANEAVILSGCELTHLGGASYSRAEGYISIGGEICYFPGQTYANVFGFPKYFTIDVTNDPDGSKIYKDGITHQAYQVRVAKIIASSGTVPTGYTNVTQIKTAIQVIAEKLPNTEWEDLPDSLDEYPGEFGSAKYMKDALGFVHLKGHFSAEDPSPDSTIGNLPNGFRPAEPMQIAIWAGTVFVQVKIETNGNIHFVGTQSQTVRLYELPPFKAV